jgi:hypothetical protein
MSCLVVPTDLVEVTYDIAYVTRSHLLIRARFYQSDRYLHLHRRLF